MTYKLTTTEGFVKKNEAGQPGVIFSNRGQIGRQMLSVYQSWLADGNTPEEAVTPAEQAEIDQAAQAAAVESANAEARQFLSDTDWKIIRHMDQIAAGIETSMTDEEYQLLLIERQEKRDSIVEA